MSIWADIIKRFAAPALPKPPQDYSLSYMDNLVSILRLYFNQLDNLLGQIVAAQPVNVSFFGSAIDAFGRARISQAYTLFDSQNRYTKNVYFDEATNTGGSVTYSANSSTVNLNVNTLSGSQVVRQTFRSFSYQPGKSLLVMNTFVMPAAQANQRIRLGYFNTENGVFLERDGSEIYIVRRTFVTGVAVDTRVAQADWNGDKLNGTGDSSFTLDLTKSQIFWEDFEWLGVGCVRCGFVIDGKTIICHTFNNANTINTVYMTTAILPVRYEITNTAGTVANATLQQICSTVISEAGYEKRALPLVARMTTPKSSIGTSFVPLVSIRLASGRTGAVVVPGGYNVLPISSSTANFEIVLVKNPTLTGASWGGSSSGNVDIDTAATSYTGGTIVSSDFVTASNKAGTMLTTDGPYNWDMQLGATMAGSSDVFTLAIRALAGSHDAIGSLNFWDLT